MNSNSNDGPPPTNTPENASFSSDIGKIFSELINTFCCQQGFVYKENSHVGSPPKAEKFKVKIEKFKDDFVIPLDFGMAEKDQLLIAHLSLKFLKESFQDNSANTPELRFNKFKQKFNELCDKHFNNFHENDADFTKIAIDVKFNENFRKYFDANQLNDYKINNEHDHILLFQYDF